MASLEQLKMLDDEETSTSSSDDGEEEGASSDDAAASNAPVKVASISTPRAPPVTNGSAVRRPPSAGRTDQIVASSATAAAGVDDLEETSGPLKRGPTSPSAPYKKRIKLSLGGSFKATNPKPAGVVDKGLTNGGAKVPSDAAARHLPVAKKSPPPGLPGCTVADGRTGANGPLSTATASPGTSHSTAPAISAVLASREKPKGPTKRSLPLKKKSKLVQAEAGLEKETPPAALSVSVAATPIPSKPMEASREAVEAVVVGTDDLNGEVDAVAAVIAQPIKRKQARLPMSSRPKTSTPAGSGTQASPAKKRATNPVRAVRLPPLSSPCLLIPPGIYRGQVNAKGLVAPDVVFAQAMETAGYTTESRTKAPHRGSSVRRVVGDMFDSDVKFCPHFPELVPHDLLGPGPEPTQLVPTAKSPESHIGSTSNQPSHSGDQSEKSVLSGSNVKLEFANEKADPAPKLRPTLPERLIRAFQSSSGGIGSDGILPPPNKGRKRRRIMGFSDMAPLSLSLPYPDHYTQMRLAYVKKVNEREKAIVDWQADQEALEDAKESDEAMGKPYVGPVISQIVIPRIPEPPDPPRLSEMHGMDKDLYEQDQHPLYPPKNNFVDHLDKNAFHISEGRYFGLTCNSVADPHFVGANCPGIGGLNVSASTGLATANSGGGAGLGGPLLVVPAHAVLSLETKASTAASMKKPSASMTTKETPKVSKSLVPTGFKTTPGVNKAQSLPKKGDLNFGHKVNAGVKSTSNTSSVALSKKKGNGPAVTAPASELRKVMEDGGEQAEKVRGIIIRGAVHAARAGKHDGRSFRASNFKVYADVARAFALYGGIKPCIRCKNNKQGSYHCRLRRKHKEADYDGGDSWIKLAPYFVMPMAELVIKPTNPKP